MTKKIFSGVYYDKKIQLLDRLILKKIDQRNNKWLLLISKIRLEKQIKKEIKTLSEDIANIDNKIWVLSRKPYIKKK